MMMDALQACRLIAESRGDAILVTTMTAMFLFDECGVTDRRMDSVPLMGGAAGLGLGLALGRPDCKVIVIDGDASLLMQLGGLVNIAEQAPANLVHAVVNNGVQFAGAANLRRPGVTTTKLHLMAKAAGYRHTAVIAEFEELRAHWSALLERDGPTFVELVVAPSVASYPASGQPMQLPDRQFTRMGEAARKLERALAADRP